MKYGILGGTFNPVHNGHISIAEDIYELLNLDKVIFVPAKVPPFKNETPLFDAPDRLKLVSAGIEKLPWATVSDIEFRRDGTSYTVTTLKDLATELSCTPKDLYFIIGVDAFIDIKKWWNYSELFALTNFVVVSRPGFEHLSGKIIHIAEDAGFLYNDNCEAKNLLTSQKTKGNQHDTQIDPSFSSKCHQSGSPSYTSNEQCSQNVTDFSKKSRSHSSKEEHNNLKRGNLPRMIKDLSNNLGLHIFIAEVRPVPVSSSDIRSKLNLKKSVKDLVPDQVFNLIREGNIY